MNELIAILRERVEVSNTINKLQSEIIESQHNRIEALERRVTTQNEIIGLKDELIAVLKDVISDQNKQISSLKDIIKNREAAIDHLVTLKPEICTMYDWCIAFENGEVTIPDDDDDDIVVTSKHRGTKLTEKELYRRHRASNHREKKSRKAYPVTKAEWEDAMHIATSADNRDRQWRRVSFDF